MRVYQQPAFIMHSSVYRETSLLVEVYSRNHGRTGLIAKGARQAKSKLRGMLLPFQPLLISWSGRGDLPVLTVADHGGMPIYLAGNGLYCGFYLNELIVRLLHRHDPHERLFDSYHETLTNLQINTDHESALRIFEKRLLQELGYGLVLDHEVERGEPVNSEMKYIYLPERGPVVESLLAREEGVSLHGRTLIALAREQFGDEIVQREAKALMRGILARLLNGRQLHSRKLFQQLRDGRSEAMEQGS